MLSKSPFIHQDISTGTKVRKSYELKKNLHQCVTCKCSNELSGCFRSWFINTTRLPLFCNGFDH